MVSILAMEIPDSFVTWGGPILAAALAAFGGLVRSMYKGFIAWAKPRVEESWDTHNNMMSKFDQYVPIVSKDIVEIKASQAEMRAVQAKHSAQFDDLPRQIHIYHSPKPDPKFGT